MLESSESVENLFTAVGTACTDKTDLQEPGPMNDRSLLRASSVASTLDKLAAETGSNASRSQDIVPEPDHHSLGTARKSKQTTLPSHTFGRLWFLRDKKWPKLWD
ncbi:hypothetical protein MTO96_003464 [Rhipicephalus appendiculatus]